MKKLLILVLMCLVFQSQSFVVYANSKNESISQNQSIILSNVEISKYITFMINFIGQDNEKL